jgi:16S rRNA (guanine1207-N2)-methyltransferase
MADATGLDRFVNKTVPLRFRGSESRVSLSHALFSSFDIDSGSRLLLKALSSHGDLESARSVLDSGCGSGVLGIALAAAFPSLRVRAVDRDALACAFTAMNAASNGMGERFDVSGGLLGEPRSERFDRIVSNLPAKAGDAALHRYIAGAPARLSPGGMAAIVIVRTLAGLARDAVSESGHELIHEEEGPVHLALLFRAGKSLDAADGTESPEEDPDGLGPYDRGTHCFNLGGLEYRIGTVRGLPDFDTPGHAIEVAARVLERAPEGGGRRAIVINPGQGHIPVFLALARGYAKQALAGRDILALRASRRALRATIDPAAPGPEAEIFHTALLDELPARLSGESPALVIAFPEDAPGFPWCESAAESAAAILPAGGFFLLCAPSSTLSVMDRRRPSGFRVAADKKEKGFRAILYERA